MSNHDISEKMSEMTEASHDEEPIEESVVEFVDDGDFLKSQSMTSDLPIFEQLASTYDEDTVVAVQESSTAMDILGPAFSEPEAALKPDESGASVETRRPNSDVSMKETNLDIQWEERFVSINIIKDILNEYQPIKVRTKPAFIVIEDKELDLFGNQVPVKKLVRRIREEIRLLKKPVLVRVKFSKMLNDGDEVVEEEEEVQEEMSIEHITSTVFVKRRNSVGSDIVEQQILVRERLREQKIQRRLISIIVVNDYGEEAKETVELRETDSVTEVIEVIQKLPGFRQISHVIDDKGDSDEEITMEPFEDTVEEEVNEESISDSSESLQRETSDPETEAELRRRLIAELRRIRNEQNLAKEKNRFLGKKLCEYYQLKGPKDKNFLVDKSVNPEGIKKLYHKRLLEFNDMVQYIFLENDKRAALLKEAKIDTKKMENYLQNNFREFVNQERELVKTFKPYEVKKLLPHTSFEELIKQQIKQDERLSKVRLDYVKTKNRLDDLKRKHAERMKKVSNLEAVNIVEYEKMRMRTQALNDKLEQKERQLNQMKLRLSHCVQSLAHARMKCAHLDIENTKLVNEIKDTKKEIKEIRAKCVNISTERKALEGKLRQLEEVRGMEKYPNLLKEYDKVIRKMNNLDNELLEANEILELKTKKLESKLAHHNKMARLRESQRL